MVLLSLGCKAGEPLMNVHKTEYMFDSKLYPIRNGELWGYSDFYGNVIIDPQFEEVSMFRYGIALVKQNKHYGYLNNNGEWLIRPRYEKAEPFILQNYEDNEEEEKGKLLVAQVDEGKGQYFINKTGSRIKEIVLLKEIGTCEQIISQLGRYSYRNASGTYELIYEYWRIEKDSTTKKIRDTTRLKLDTIIELGVEYVLLRKDSKYAFYCLRTSRGIDYRNKKRIIVPMDSIHVIDPEFIYEDVKFIVVDGKEQPSAIYKKCGKWGIPGYLKEPIVPFIYYDMNPGEKGNSYVVEYEKDKSGYISIIRDSYNRSKSIIVEHFKREKASNMR